MAPRARARRGREGPAAARRASSPHRHRLPAGELEERWTSAILAVKFTKEGRAEDAAARGDLVRPSCGVPPFIATFHSDVVRILRGRRAGRRPGCRPSFVIYDGGDDRRSSSRDAMARAGRRGADGSAGRRGATGSATPRRTRCSRRMGRGARLARNAFATSCGRALIRFVRETPPGRRAGAGGLRRLAAARLRGLLEKATGGRSPGTGFSLDARPRR